jgi:hypothetical protein
MTRLILTLVIALLGLLTVTGRHYLAARHVYAYCTAGAGTQSAAGLVSTPGPPREAAAKPLSLPGIDAGAVATRNCALRTGPAPDGGALNDWSVPHF